MVELVLLPTAPSREAAVQERLQALAGPWLDLEAATEAVLQRTQGQAASERELTRTIREVASAALIVAARAGGTQKGERAALDRLLDLWQADVFRWCRLLGGASVSVDDAAHDTLLALVTELHRLSDPSRFRAWLWGITWRTVRGHRRRAWVRRWVPGLVPERADPRGDAGDAYDRAETAAGVLRILDTLPKAQRELLWLAYAEGLSRAEIAEMLRLAPGTLNRRLTEARSAFEAATRAEGAS